jgi:hypothetical protein
MVEAASTGGTPLSTSLDLVVTLGGTDAKKVADFANLFKDKALKTEFEASFSLLPPEQAADKIDLYSYLTAAGEIFDGQLDIPFEFYQSNPEAATAAINDIQEFQALSQEGFSFDVYAQVYGQEAADRLKATTEEMGAEFDNLDEKGKLDFAVMFNIGTNLEGDPVFLQMIKNGGVDFDLGLGGKVAQVVPDIIGPPAPSDTEDTTPTDSGGGGAEPQIDSLIKKLRDLRMATVDMKKGWEGMQQVLEKVFAGGTKGIDVFSGLSNQIRRMGVGESLIEMIVGMDPDEYNKRKNELFVFDKAGNIVNTTAKLKNMNAAFNSIAIGEYVNTQQQFIQNTNHQFTAMTMLTAQGLSFVEAYEMVQDQALATAIAMGATRAEIEQLINITRQMAGVRERYNKISAEEQAAKSVRETNKEFASRVAILKKLSKSSGQYSDEQINAILNDSNVGKLFLSPQIDAKALAQALKNAEQQANLDLQVAISTEEGKKELFDNLTSEISEQFARQENKINIDFALATEGSQDIVRDAQNKIAAIQFAIDDYEAELKGISDQEELINEKYDDRFEALDKVAAANEKVAASQKAQLNIADALSRGDIAAAAAAQQELRAQQAKDAADSRKEQMEKQREAELANIRSASGQSREQLEGNIKNLRDQIFGIEESELEPAQEAIRIAEYNRDVQIDALEVSGKTRDQWEQIASQVDIATTNAEEFALSVQRALALYANLVNGTELDPMLFGGEVIDATPAPESGGGGGGGGGGAAATSTQQGSTQVSKPNVSGLLSAGLNPQAAGTSGPAYVKPPPPVIIMGSNMTPPTRVSIAAPRVPASPQTPKKSPTVSWGGKVPGMSGGGMIIPKRMNVGGMVKGYAAGGFSRGSDIVPAVLTPGEFVVRRPAVMGFGKDKLEQINKGTYPGGSMYNYNLVVNVKSDANPDKIAQTVIQQIKRVDSQRVKGNRF